MVFIVKGTAPQLSMFAFFTINSCMNAEISVPLYQQKIRINR
jgi:hypothetical protein